MGSLDLIDYTALEKRGIIKKKELKKMAAPVSKDGFIDFSAMGQDKINDIVNSQQGQLSNPSSSISALPTSSVSTQSTPSFTSFWDDVPGANQSQSQSTTSTETSYYGNQSSFSSPSSSSQDGQDMATLKVKLEDLEYKLARLTEKLDLITSKL